MTRAATIPPPTTITAAPPPMDVLASKPPHVIIVDGEPALRRTLSSVLLARGLRVDSVGDGPAALEYIETHGPDVALIDMTMPHMSGLDLLAVMRERGFAVETIMMAAFADVDAAVSAVKAGAYDFLMKPFRSDDAVVLAITKAAEHRRLLEHTRRLEQRLEAQERFGELIGRSPKMAGVYRLIEGVAAATSTVLILGESGTGKELVARAIHQHSARATKPFVAVNCAAIPKELVESELFGHVRGAFTGAQNARAGLFETAHEGTIFLDEVGDLPLAAQVKLLRTLQEGEIKRVGSDETRNVDVRVLAATNVELASRIHTGEFRKDLFYRLNVIAIQLPPLRDRGDDVVILTQHFLRKFARRMGRDVKRISPDAVRKLKSYEWPGNVRELEHAIEHAVVLAQGEIIQESDLPFERFEDETPTQPRMLDRLGAASSFASEFVNLPYPEAKRRALAGFDEAYVSELLRRADGNVSEAARQAGLDRSNFRRIARKLRSI